MLLVKVEKILILKLTFFLCLKDHSGTLKNSLLQVDQNCVRNSYDVFSLLR